MLTLQVPAASELIALTEAKLQCRVVAPDEDELFRNTLIPAARDRAELATRRAIGVQTYDYILDEFDDRSDAIELPKPPLISVDSLTYVDATGVLQTMAPALYLVQAPAGPRCARGLVSLAPDTVWPFTQGRRAAVTIRFTAGYTANTLPPLLKRAMLVDIGAMYENRENIAGTALPGESDRIYRSFRSYSRRKVAA